MTKAMASEKILIVDDSPFSRKLLRLLLRNDGYELREAEDAGQALQMLETWRPQLILMDVHLPGMDGLEKSDSRFGTTETGLKNRRSRERAQESFSRNSK